MPLPKILEPILPTSPQLGDKHSCILSPVVPMSPPSNHFGNNNNLIDLTTAIDEEDQTINIEKEKQNNTEEKKQSIAIEEKKVATEVKQDIATEEDYKQEERIATTTVSAPVSRRASPIIDQHDNEILIDTTVHEDINQQKEESDGEFNDDDGKEHEYGYSTSTVIVMTSRDDLDEKEQKHDSQDTLVEDKQVKMRDFIEPIQVSTATPVKEETDNYAVETSFKKSTSSGSFRSRCIQVFRGIKMRTHTSEKSQNGKKSASSNHIDTLTRSVSLTAVTSADGKLASAHSKNTTTNDYQSNKNTSDESLPSREIGSAVDYLQKLCDQSFFGRY